MDYEAVDKAALKQALLNLNCCPRCRKDMKGAKYYDNVIFCDSCHESWFLQDNGVWK